jgi:hypothetical protein
MHDSLNSGALLYNEPYFYHPHITLAQGFSEDRILELRDRAMRRWAEYAGRRHFDVDVITFVQNTAANRWQDLADMRLASRNGSRLA